MRTFLLHATAWASALQTVGAPSGGAVDVARILGIAGVLGSVTVFVYRLGAWRQDMENTRKNLGTQVNAFRDEMAHLDRRLDRLERRPQ